MMKCTLFLTTLAVLTMSIAVRGDDANDDQKKLEGTWAPVAGELAGKELPEQSIKTWRLVVKDGKYTVTIGLNKDIGTTKIDPSAKIKTMDVSGTEGPNKGKTFLCIYEL